MAEANAELQPILQEFARRSPARFPNEFGIRMALGAHARDVVGLVLAGTTWTIGIGLLAGVGLCLLLDKLASYWLAESAKDPMILASVIALLLAVSVSACVAPARRAASIDPMEAVRHDEAQRTGSRGHD